MINLPAKQIMKKFFLLVALAGLSWVGKAQTASDSVQTVIRSFFDAMYKCDTAALRDCFYTGCIMQTVVNTPDGGRVRNESVDDFIRQIASLQPGDASERIVFEAVKTDGPLAFAWTPYSFYYKSQFSHCGVNCFQLVRISSGWKIHYVIDTRRRNGCKE